MLEKMIALVIIRYIYTGSCGSCYAFSSMGMLEARLRVMSNLTVNPVFSTQDVVECCQYSQGMLLHGINFSTLCYLVIPKLDENFMEIS